MRRLRMVEFQRFLMALSVRPGSLFEISTQWLPSWSWDGGRVRGMVHCEC